MPRAVSLGVVASTLATILTSAERPGQVPARPRVEAAAEATDVAFGQLVARSAPWITSLVWRLLGWSRDAAAIEDVVQEVFLAAWSRRESLRDPAAAAGWLRTIAVRQARNHVRRAQRRRRLLSLCGFGPGEEPADLAAAPAGEMRDRVRRGLARLRHADREVLVLRYLQGCANEELAAVLGIGRSALDTRLSRARRRLQEVLDADGRADGRAERIQEPTP